MLKEITEKITELSLSYKESFKDAFEGSKVDIEKMVNSIENADFLKEVENIMNDIGLKYPNQKITVTVYS